ncbi:ASPIC/UnbV domain-containing protein [Flavobacterium saliperosum S13]|uniref:Por secretion system C-terminal sorting domain-containing protein n=2 Tax=Flavobacterium saliperosum TaxID=329186 RepID=A0A1G4V249_9FLAO|nr:FG-GAP-like repeat-containing protein [Flavobacterium saliperosum]ESU28603.1 ASPIC/UnbV domain-containing protein [Flavobacterium saliperosum S13]SCW99963.1 Por secretion system C-terminal sorting domain-containing protein [Flavobacterium saliperosum]
MKKITLLLLGMISWMINAQDTCATAVPITAGSHIVSVIDGPTPITILCGPNTTNATLSEWYTYTPTNNYTVTITTDLAINSGKDTRFNVYTGNCTSLSCFAGDDDSGSIGNGFLSISSFNVTAGTTYYIAFDNRWNPSGFTFDLIEQPIVASALSFSSQSVALTGAYNNCVVDMNGDNLDDIVSVSATQLQILQKNSGSAGFTTVTIPVTNVINQPSWSIAAGDYNKDGYNDLVLGGGNGATFIQTANNGTTYNSVNFAQYIFCQRSNFTDINKDGNLDAFVCHDVDPNVYFMNNGSGVLSYIQGGLGDHAEGGNYGSIWVDYDNDGDSDLFIAKCRGGATTANINELHRNNGNGTFTNVSIAANMADPIQTWSSAWGDFDNDGDMDALVGASSNANGMHKLMRNNGDGTFSDVTAGSGYDTFASMGVEHVAHDFNNDGFVDVFGAGNKIMLNNGNMTFTPHSVTPTNGPIGDLNNDGFLDVQNGNVIYYNNPNANNWIKINLKGIQSNSNGIGARVEIYGAWGKQIRDVRSGDGFRNMSTLNTHFGIGTETQITQVIIKWPSGVVDIIANPTTNQALTVIEGSTLGIAENNLGNFTMYPNPTNDFIRFNTVNADEKIKSVTIYDVSGKLVKKDSASNNSVSVQELENGTYVIILENHLGKKHSSKFIKN